MTGKPSRPVRREAARKRTSPGWHLAARPTRPFVIRRAIAMYPVANKPRITAITRNAAGIPVSPVVAYALGITPAATVKGATPARMNASTAGIPSRSRASARDIALAEAGTVFVDMVMAPCSWWLVRISGAVGEHGAVD